MRRFVSEREQLMKTCRWNWNATYTESYVDTERELEKRLAVIVNIIVSNGGRVYLFVLM